VTYVVAMGYNRLATERYWFHRYPYGGTALGIAAGLPPLLGSGGKHQLRVAGPRSKDLGSSPGFEAAFGDTVAYGSLERQLRGTAQSQVLPRISSHGGLFRREIPEFAVIPGRVHGGASECRSELLGDERSKIG
jgi:hypothetical protein